MISLERIRSIALVLKHKAIKACRITMAQARANSISLHRNKLARRYPKWFLVAGTPCYVFTHTLKRSYRMVRR